MQVCLWSQQGSPGKFLTSSLISLMGVVTQGRGAGNLDNAGVPSLIHVHCWWRSAAKAQGSLLPCACLFSMKTQLRLVQLLGTLHYPKRETIDVCGIWPAGRLWIVLEHLVSLTCLTGRTIALTVGIFLRFVTNSKGCTKRSQKGKAWNVILLQVEMEMKQSKLEKQNKISKP